ncbi:uncharacterized protein LOC126835862 [Adelges cooleyi]|uniref:uncharacterized protein LOC126835862 n=1 Tax=Adelges cooleyi TaxID=133065 RepID=UPI0021804D9E|nr:uncharacterized protein LOC126835862 [Adelges cooleyi]
MCSPCRQAKTPDGRTEVLKRLHRATSPTEVIIMNSFSFIVAVVTLAIQVYDTSSCDCICPKPLFKPFNVPIPFPILKPIAASLPCSLEKPPKIPLLLLSKLLFPLLKKCGPLPLPLPLPVSAPKICLPAPISKPVPCLPPVVPAPAPVCTDLSSELLALLLSASPIALPQLTPLAPPAPCDISPALLTSLLSSLNGKCTPPPVEYASLAPIAIPSTPPVCPSNLDIPTELLLSLLSPTSSGYSPCY